jgi:hypothetical protein
MLFGVTAHARAEDGAPCVPLPAAATGTDEHRFEEAVRRFTRLWRFTQGLVAERERREFASATAEYERFADLTRELAARHAAEEERAFEASVALYLRKRELTRTLVREHAEHESR